jgi:hypothetical protein
MTDDVFYRPNYRPPPRAARPGGPLWSFVKDGHTWSAELRDHGAAGVEAQILCDGGLVSGRLFDLQELATRWAEQVRRRSSMGCLSSGRGGFYRFRPIGQRPKPAFRASSS